MPNEPGPLPEYKPTTEDQELNTNLQRQALRCARLRKVLDVLEQYPEGGATASRIMKLALLEFSRQLVIMQRVAERALSFTTAHVPLGTLIDEVTKEMEV